MHSFRSLIPAALAVALAAASAPAGAQDAQANLYIDVATHAMPGMGGVGALGRLAGAVTGGGANYGMASHPGMPGRYMDVALHNRSQPGTAASQAVPRGLRLGNAIDLLPPVQDQTRTDGGSGGSASLGLADGGPYTVRYYWGCGDQVRAGQPTQFTMSVRNGEPVYSGRAPTPRQVPHGGINPGPEHALWPNPSTRRAVPGKASLAGSHEVSGGGLPAPMRFDLGAEHDFMPELEIERDAGEHGVQLSWNSVAGARGYFIHATAMDGDAVVMWSSSSDGYAGHELIDFLPESVVADLTRKGTVLAADARSCRIPREVFGEGAPMVQMVAYGNERTIRQEGDWQVRVRTKSTAMLMPSGLAAPSAREVGEGAARETGKGMLRGLLRR